MPSELAKKLREELDTDSLDPAIEKLRALNEQLAAQNEMDRDDDDFTPVTVLESFHRNGRVPR